MRFPALGLILLTALVYAGTAVAAPALGFRPAGITATDTPTEAAVALIEQRPGLVDGADIDQLVFAGVDRGKHGITTVRFDQELHGVPVLGGEVVVAVDAKRRVIAAAGEAYDGLSPALGPSISALEAQQIAIASIGKSLGEGLIASTPSLVVFDPATAGAPGGPRAALTWNFEVTRGDAVRHNVFVDATSGIVVQAMSAIETVARYVCDANDTTTKVPCSSGYARTDLTGVNGNTDVDNAYDLSGVTYDFYAALGRNSIDGAGGDIRSTVRYCRTGYTCPNYPNAFWNGTQMVYGTGYAVADDVVGHELTHGVTDYTSSLFYWYQSGAINEAMSDIMGEFVDLANLGTGAREDTPEKRWLIGEDLPIGAIRDMANPPAFNDPDKISSTYYTRAFSDSGGVHSNSGVANKTAYLIADGGTFNGQTVTGIGLIKSARLWYTTNASLLHASDFSDLADALERTCTGLVNLVEYGFTSADCTQVSKAITATELRTPVVPVPDVCSAGVPAYAFNDGFDNGTAAWTIGRTIGPTNLWYADTAISPDGATMTWPTTASKNVRGVDSSVRSDSTMAMTDGVVIPAGAYLRLNHWFGFEISSTTGMAFDGGIIEYSSDGGSWTDIGSLTAINGYNGSINAIFENPLAGQAGFVGVSNGALATRYDLTTLAGHTVKFRFRVATDSSGGSYGWYIDDVQVYSCAAAAVIIGVSPSSGLTVGGTPITISGAYLTGTSSVTVGGVAATNVTVVSDTTVTATTPAHAAGVVAVEVVTPGGTVAVAGAFTYVAPDVPVSNGSGGATPAAAPPVNTPAATTPAATSAVATPPASGAWTTNATTDVITSLLAYKPGTVYSIKATKGRISRSGTCLRTGAIVTCSVKAPNGRWKIIVTPKTGAKAGKAIVRVVKT